MRQRAPISALIKPIGLCGTQNAQKNFWTRRKFFCAFWVPQSPIGLISAEIGARCRIPGHANVGLFEFSFSSMLLRFFVEMPPGFEVKVKGRGHGQRSDVKGQGQVSGT